jgi:sodium transport system permease protein
MRTILLVLKKEMLDVARNRRRLAAIAFFNLFLLPLLSLTPMFFLMRRTVNNVIKPLEVPVQGIEHAPDFVKFIEDNTNMLLKPAEDVERLVADKKFSAGLIIPVDYAARIKNGETATIVIVMDKRQSMNLTWQRLKAAVEKYNKALRGERLEQKEITDEFLNPIVMEELNIATPSETTGSLLGLMIPGFVMAFSLTSGLSIAISAIAGEKERLTLEPVLFTAVNRTLFIIGKLVAVLANVFLTIIAFCMTMLVYGCGIIVVMLYVFKDIDLTPVAKNPEALTLPATGAASAPALIGYALEPSAMIIFLLSILPIVILGAALQIMISSVARNSEEAFTYSLPLGVFSLAPMFASFFLDEFTPALGHYAIPVFGTILSMRDLLSGHVYAASLLMMFGSSALYAILAIAVAVWMFNREEILLRA